MEFLKLLAEVRTPFLDAVISLVTHLGAETLFMVVALVFFWCIDKHRGYFLLFGGFVGTVCNQFLKMIFRVPRPWVLDPKISPVESAIEGATGYSFPSGHTQSATTLYGGIARSSKRHAVQITGIALCFVIAFTRMYLGVHTPKDVIVSLLIGFVLVLLLYPLIEASRTNPKFMYGIIIFSALLTLANLLFVSLYPFSPDVDTVNLADAQENAWKLFAAIAGISIIYPVERKWIRFETRAVWWAQILKVVAGLLIIILIKELLKWPLNTLFGVNVGSFVRYFLMVMGAGLLWPMTFKWFAKRT